MTAVPVTIQSSPPKTRPETPTLVATTALIQVADLDDLKDGIECSCSGSDDNPH
jgi:hypothetical protein